MPQTVAALKALGVTLGPAQAVPFRGIRFIGEGRVAEGAFPQGYGVGVRRTTLHQALVDESGGSGRAMPLGNAREEHRPGRGLRWIQAKFDAAGSSARTGKTLWCASGPDWIEGARRKRASDSGSISASRRGQTLWKFIGAVIARLLSLR